jgi:hypothetical protein
MIADIHAAATVRIPQPRAATTGRVESAYARQLATPAPRWPLALVALTSAAAGCGLVWWLGTLARGWL